MRFTWSHSTSMAGDRASRSRARNCYNQQVDENNDNDIHVNEHHADEPNTCEAHADEVTINEDDAGHRPKKKRGPTMAVNLWSYAGAPKTIIYDDDSQPIGGDANKLTTFLGCLARNDEFFPTSTPSWFNINETYMQRAWDEIQYQKKGKEIDQADMYMESHTRTDKSILRVADCNVQKIIELKNVEQLVAGSGSLQSTGRINILAQVLGSERHGQLR